METILGIPHSRVLRRIWHPLLTMTGVSLVASTLHCLLHVPGLPTMQAHTLLGSGLSLLLVFRTNSAYQRFQEGRKIWNDILDICRDIALTTAMFRKEAGPHRVRAIRTSVQAFPFAMQQHVRAQESSNIKQRLDWLLEEMREARGELSRSSKGVAKPPPALSDPQAHESSPNRPSCATKEQTFAHHLPDADSHSFHPKLSGHLHQQRTGFPDDNGDFTFSHSWTV
eukprot:symbB.v1.2.007074.t1/scaffold422.1/size209270/3